MKVPKEIGRKAEKYQKLCKEAAALYDEIKEYLEENTSAADVFISDLAVVDRSQVRGKLQNDDEFVDQVMQWEDSGYGSYYHPIEGTNKYLRYNYDF